MTFGVILLLMLVAFGDAESAVGFVTLRHSGFRAVDVEPVFNAFFRVVPENQIVTDSIDICLTSSCTAIIRPVMRSRSIQSATAIMAFSNNFFI